MTTPAASTDSMRSYDAFISYSHAVDGKLAPAVQTALHRFGRPWYRVRALHVFRDETNLSANPALWSSIVAALDQSRFFILLASREAAESKWVNQEVEYWCEHRAGAGLLVVLTEGRLVWDDRVGDVDWNLTASLPHAIRGHLDAEPRSIDLRWARTVDDLSLANPQFRDAMADLAAPLHGRPKDELMGEDVRQHRRTVRLVRAALVTLATLATIAVAGGVVALRERDNAIEQAQVARSRELAATAISQLPADPELSVLLAREAADIAETPQAATALRLSLEDAHAVGRIPAGGGISDLSASADGRLLAMSRDRVAQIWDRRSRKLLATLHGHGDPCARSDGPPCTVTAPLVSVALSSDGQLLATAGADGRILVWDWRAPKRPRYVIKSRGVPVADIAFSADGKHIGTVTEAKFDSGAEVWDWRQERRERTLLGFDDDATSVAFAADGRSLIATSIDGTARVWDWAKDDELAVLKRRNQLLMNAEFSPVAPELAVVAGSDGAATIWNWQHDRVVAELRGTPGGLAQARFSPDGSMILTAGDDGVARLWDWQLNPRAAATELRGHRGAITSAAFVPETGYAVTGGIDGTTRMWSRLRRQPIAKLAAGAFLETAAFDRTGELVASVGAGTTTLFRWRSAKAPLGRLGPHGVTGDIPPPENAEFSPDGRLVVATSYDGRVLVWDWQRDQVIARLQGGTSGSFSPDGGRIVTIGNEGTARIWAWRRGKVVATLPGPARELLRTATFSPDGAHVVTVTSGGTVRVWEWKTRRRVLVLPARAFERAAFSPDGALLVTSGPTPQVWDWKRRRLVASLRAPANTRSATFSPNGRLVITASTDNTTRVWDWRIEQPILEVREVFPQTWQSAAAATFSPDNTRFLTAGDDGVVRIYLCDICGDLAQLVTLTGERVTRRLTRQERARYIG